MPQLSPLLAYQRVRSRETERARNLTDRYAAALVGLAFDVLNETPTSNKRRDWANHTLNDPLANALETRMLFFLLSNPVVAAAVADEANDLTSAPSDGDIYFVAGQAFNQFYGQPDA